MNTRSDLREASVVLVVGLTGEDLDAWCDELREQLAVPVIAVAGGSDSKPGLTTKESRPPVAYEQLQARVNGALRKLGDVHRIHFDGWTLDTRRRELFDRRGKLVPMTDGEFRLLTAFVDHPNQVLSRDSLMRWTRGRKAGPFDRSVDVQVGRVREKLGDQGPGFRLIKTVHGRGYVLTAEVE